MGKVAVAAETKNRKRKKKGRPSLLDLQKRSLRLQQKQQQPPKALTLTNPNLKNPNPPPNPNSQNPTRRSTRRNPNPDGLSPAAGYTVEEYDEDEGDDDDERKEKKLKLVDKLPPSHLDDHHRRPRPSTNLNSTSCASDSNADGENREPSKKTRKLNAVSDRSGDKGEKVSKATDTPHGSRSRLESGPTTPLPDKKLLVFILDRLQKKDIYGVFSDPVDPEELPDYHDIIDHPMDFGTVRKKLDGGVYPDLEHFEADVFLLCANAMQYNSPDTIYFRQARSIQELAKKDFENLRQDSDDSDSQPKVVRRGRPPKNLKKSIGGPPSERAGPDCLSDATLASVEVKTLCGNSYNLRKGPAPCKLRPADAPVKASHRAESIEIYSGLSEWNNDFSVLTGVSMKHVKKQFTLDDNRRDTYKQSFPSASGYETPVLTALDGGLKRLMVVGLQTEHGYARSLARFAANLGPVVWKIASTKIHSVLPAGLKFGPGWVEEKESQQPPSSLYEKQKASTDSMYDGHPSASLLSYSCSSSVLASTSSLHGKENMVEEGISQSKFSSLDGISGIRTEGPFQYQQKSVIQPGMNGFGGGFLSPQIRNIKPVTTSTAKCTLEGASALPQALGMASGNSNTSVGSFCAEHLDSDETKLHGSSSRAHSGKFSSLGFGPGSNTVPEFGLCGKPSWQELSHHQKQEYLPNPPDLNVIFHTPGTPNSTVQINSPQPPDLALQL